MCVRVCMLKLIRAICGDAVALALPVYHSVLLGHAAPGFGGYCPL